MAATVYIPNPEPGEYDFIGVDVPAANHAHITDDGYLRLKSTESWGGVDCGLFKHWDHVVIDPKYVRGPDGRFVTKG